MSDAPSTLRIRRHFKAPRRLVFDAWTNPGSTVGWWGPRGFTAEFQEIDPRPGGRFRIGMRSLEGQLHVSAGAYREVVPPERLVMTHGWEGDDGRLGHETLVTVTLNEHDGGTEMIFEQTGFESAGSRDGHAGGWGEAFDSLDAALARA